MGAWILAVWYDALIMTNRTFFGALTLSVAVVAIVGGCGGGGGGGGGLAARTPAAAHASLTYESFGKPLLEKYCVSCHSGARAADGVMLDSQAGVLAVKARVFDEAGGTNHAMPPEGKPAPTAEEREMLGDWLAAGAQ